MNRLNKTKVERVVDHEAERIERQRKEKAESRALAAEKESFSSSNSGAILHSYLLIQRKEAEELAKQRAAEKAARDYALLDAVDPEDEEQTKPKTVQEMMDDFM